jgi:NTP pyrophosphatase (non-canonical NTP hydrolase)/nucleoside 2-deoxyribosyltransferase
MALLELSNTRTTRAAGLRVVLCGSFRRDPDGLATTFAALQAQFEVLSPQGLNFVDPSAAFVRLPHEVGRDASDIEAQHLNAMTSADFVWLHAPDGYVGTNAAMELGHAAALGIPVFGSTPPDDEVLATFVRVVDTPRVVTAELLDETTNPGRGISRLQQYYDTAAHRRGWSNETSDETLTRLAGEVGELAEAVRRANAGIRAEDDPDADVAAELADIQLYLVHLANNLGFDLAVAVTDKEQVNARRFPRVRDVA